MDQPSQAVVVNPAIRDSALPPRAEPPAVLSAWPRSAQLTTAFLLGVAGTLLTVHILGTFRWASRPAELDRGALPLYRIDLNRADRAELLQIPGVGPALMERIDEHRRQQPFRTVDDLRLVRGIGPATLERVRPWVCVGSDPDDEEMTERVAIRQAAYPPPDDQPAMAAPARTPTKKEAVLAKPLDLNRASAEELQRLPGIGPALSQRIVAERSKKPFQSVNDLRRVSGIGPKTLERLRPSITVAPMANPETKNSTDEQ